MIQKGNDKSIKTKQDKFKTKCNNKGKSCTSNQVNLETDYFISDPNTEGDRNTSNKTQ